MTFNPREWSCRLGSARRRGEWNGKRIRLPFALVGATELLALFLYWQEMLLHKY
jgi:hypothetical protein